MAGDITVTSMMKFQGDTQYYKIDEGTHPSNFKAEAGSIPSADIEGLRVTTTGAEVETPALTYADNQIFQIRFKPAHSVARGGYIKIDIPSAFTMSSQASAVALFQITGDIPPITAG